MKRTSKRIMTNKRSVRKYSMGGRPVVASDKKVAFNEKSTMIAISVNNDLHIYRADEVALRTGKDSWIFVDTIRNETGGHIHSFTWGRPLVGSLGYDQIAIAYDDGVYTWKVYFDKVQLQSKIDL